MGSVEALAESAGIALERRGGVALVRSADAAAFLDEADRHGAVVLGAEGFRLNGPDLVPDLDAILDLSGMDDRGRSLEEARAFVEAVATPELLFEFVVYEGG